MGEIPYYRLKRSDVEIRWVGKRTFLPEPHPGGGRTREGFSEASKPPSQDGGFCIQNWTAADAQ